MHWFTKEDIQLFSSYLLAQERSLATIQKYLRSLERFYFWLPQEKLVDKATVIAYRETLLESHAPAGVNTILVGLELLL